MRPHLMKLVCLLSLSAARAQSLAPGCAVALRSPATTSAIVPVRLLALPAKARDHYGRAAVALAAGQPERADTEAARALTFAPEFAEANLLRAVLALRAGSAANALLLLASARTVAPDLPWLNILTAEALNHLSRFDAAIAELESIHGSEISSWQASYERTRAEIGRRNVEGALHWSALAVASAPVGCTEARLLRANTFNLAGRRTDVITELETYLAEDRLQVRHAQVRAALDKLQGAAQANLADKAHAGPTSAAGHALLGMD